MKILVSVRDADEALMAARAGVHFIDLKEPSNGALGGLPVPVIGDIVNLLRRVAPDALVSATIGDWPAESLDQISAQVMAVRACGVDYVKVGIVPGPGAGALVGRLGALMSAGLPLVPVFIADAGVPDALVLHALSHRFPALMLDTAHKRAGSLLGTVPTADLQTFTRQVQACGALAGLAGALCLDDLLPLAALAPDFAGFRSAVCVGERTAALDAQRLRRLLASTASAPDLCLQG